MRSVSIITFLAALAAPLAQAAAIGGGLVIQDEPVTSLLTSWGYKDCGIVMSPCQVLLHPVLTFLS